MLIEKIEEIALNILEKIGLKELAKWYVKHKEGMRYLIFGGLTTVISILSYILFSSLILKGMQDETLKVNISEIISFIVGVIFAYVTNKLYVFNSKTTKFKELFKEIVSFVGCRIATEIISILMMNMAVVFSINDTLMKVVSSVVIIVLNFVLSKIWIFKNGG